MLDDVDYRCQKLMHTLAVPPDIGVEFAVDEENIRDECLDVWLVVERFVG